MALHICNIYTYINTIVASQLSQENKSGLSTPILQRYINYEG